MVVENKKGVWESNPVYSDKQFVNNSVVAENL